LVRQHIALIKHLDSWRRTGPSEIAELRTLQLPRETPISSHMAQLRMGDREGISTSNSWEIWKTIVQSLVEELTTAQPLPQKPIYQLRIGPAAGLLHHLAY
jgi:hypothetical protein